MSKHERHEEEQEDAERWLITYADMITLLMAFFIMMYSMSVVDLKKFEALSESARHVFGGKIAGVGQGTTRTGGLLKGGSGLMDGLSNLGANRASLVNHVRRELDEGLPDRLRANVGVTHRGGVVTISLRTNSVTFRLGEARLTEEVRRILDVLGPPLRESRASLLIEGHTCDLPINTPRFPSNWELSAQRATNVMVYLIRNCGISADHICAVGYADTRPLAPNKSDAGRMRNRRVDIVVLSEEDATHRGAPDMPSRTRQGDESVKLSRVHLVPPIDLRDRYYQHTGRRAVDAPATD